MYMHTLDGKSLTSEFRSCRDGTAQQLLPDLTCRLQRLWRWRQRQWLPELRSKVTKLLQEEEAEAARFQQEAANKMMRQKLRKQVRLPWVELPSQYGTIKSCTSIFRELRSLPVVQLILTSAMLSPPIKLPMPRCSLQHVFARYACILNQEPHELRAACLTSQKQADRELSLFGQVVVKPHISCRMCKAFLLCSWFQHMVEHVVPLHTSAAARV